MEASQLKLEAFTLIKDKIDKDSAQRRDPLPRFALE